MSCGGLQAHNISNSDRAHVHSVSDRPPSLLRTACLPPTGESNARASAQAQSRENQKHKQRRHNGAGVVDQHAGEDCARRDHVEHLVSKIV